MTEEKPETILRHGGVGIIPTDTLYGLVGSAFSKKAIRRIYQIKSRNDSKPLIILIASFLDLNKFGLRYAEILPSIKSVLGTYRGPVSIIVSCDQKKFEYLHRGTKSLAFRVPKSKRVQMLLEKTGPLVAPSANPQGLKPAHTIAEAKKYFGSHVDFYISGGRRIGKASRVISLLSGKPIIVRK